MQPPNYSQHEANERLAALTNAIHETFVKLFPMYTYVGPGQALAVIDSEVAALREAAAREREACAQIAADECMANRGLLAHLPAARECALTAHTIYTRIQSRARADDAAGGDGGNG
jgi:hypothetical protein